MVRDDVKERTSTSNNMASNVTRTCKETRWKDERTDKRETAAVQGDG